MVRLPDARCLGRVRVKVSEPGPGRVLAPAGDPLLARGSQGAGALPCHQAHRPPTLINGLRFTQQLLACHILLYQLCGICRHVATSLNQSAFEMNPVDIHVNYLPSLHLTALMP